jgi:hypothetical protein
VIVALQGCVIVTLHARFRYCCVTRLRDCCVEGCVIVVLQGCVIVLLRARLRDCSVACKVASLLRCKVARLRDCERLILVPVEFFVIKKARKFNGGQNESLNKYDYKIKLPASFHCYCNHCYLETFHVLTKLF